MPPHPTPTHSTDLLLQALAGMGTSDVVSRGDLLTVLFVVVAFYLLGQLVRAAIRFARLVVIMAIAGGGLLIVLLALMRNVS